MDADVLWIWNIPTNGLALLEFSSWTIRLHPYTCQHMFSILATLFKSLSHHDHGNTNPNHGLATQSKVGPWITWWENST